ncbi:hypothetical protein BU26DRAFT_557358 [Trematosphaeria pertusa]|uniref:Uncharacterized protein n=1 Tax=Trematosphaeria pertusa TaxID=390896 RepID=A0A6A6J0M1_9PLEO|nr:uncharacterized protein BU26DRAFT_557358 [Trematosphaeria pertusa]KAF2255857.1 hypothetical protein BU26DRAFT_557358 [Trematosphaeria pertusa]
MALHGGAGTLQCDATGWRSVSAACMELIHAHERRVGKTHACWAPGGFDCIRASYVQQIVTAGSDLDRGVQAPLLLHALHEKRCQACFTDASSPAMPLRAPLAQKRLGACRPSRLLPMSTTHAHSSMLIERASRRINHCLALRLQEAYDRVDKRP